MVKVDPVNGAVMANLFTVVAVATPIFGVTKVGEVSTTNLVPVPVCEAIDVALPEEVMTPVRLASVVTVAALPVMFVWSPVLTPEMVEVPVTARVGVLEPERVMPLTEVGVIAPKVRVIAGVIVEVATEPETPLAVVTDTDVTVPVPPEFIQVTPPGAEESADKT